MVAEPAHPISHEDPAVIGILAADPAEQAEALVRMGLGKAGILVLDNACEARCFFCSNPGTLHVPPERMTHWSAIERALGRRVPGVETLLIGGNDPVLHPDFDRAVGEALRQGYTSTHVMTSGLSLDAGRLAWWREHGVVSLSVPVYSVEAGLHDSVCGTPSHARLLAGLARARAAGLAIHVHTIAMRRTLGAIAALARWSRSEFGGPLSVAPLRQKADVFGYDAEAVPLAELGPFLESLGPDAPVSLLGMPSCVAPSLPRGGSEIMEVYFRTQRRAYADACSPCAARAGCPGVVVAELERRGAAGLTPVLGGGREPR
jgi:pyruvate-formate lyase-activating enzyme